MHRAAAQSAGDDPHAPAYIATVPKKGYRLIAAVAPVGSDESHPLKTLPEQRSSRRSRRLGAGLLLLAITMVVGITVIAGFREEDAEPAGPASAATPAIAVLPFSELGNHPSGGLSGNNLAKAVANDLAQVPALRVIDQGSAASVAGNKLDVPAVTRQLKVDYLLVGELRFQGELSVLEASLLKGSGAELWRHHYAYRQDEQVHGRSGEHIDPSRLVDELDSLHFLSYSLRKLGKVHEADAVLKNSLTLVQDRKTQGYTGFPELSFAEARAYALQGNRALAVATLRQAVAQGWRHYWSMHSDPRWNSLRSDPEFGEILAEVRSEVERMGERAPRFAHNVP